MLSHIDAVDIRQGIIDTLALSGANSIPQDADMDPVRFVYEMGQGGFSFPSTGLRSWAYTATSIAGTAAKNFPLLGPTGWQGPGSTAVALRTNASLNEENSRVLCLDAEIVFDAAGALAFNGKPVRIELTMADTKPGGQNSWINITTYTIATATLKYQYFDTAAWWNHTVLYPQGLFLTVRSVDGTNFPANTTLNPSGQHIARKRTAWLPY